MERFPEEACGVIVDGKYLPCRNIADDPVNHFEIDPVITNTLQAEDRLQGVAHSHPHARMPWPSKSDMRGQFATEVPWAIASVCYDGENPPAVFDLFWFGDQLPRLPLINREFRPNVTDCFELVRDWYLQERGIFIENHPRSHNFWEIKEDPFEHFERFGFARITVRELEIGDAMVCSLGNNGLPNHCAVLVDDGVLLHHKSNRLSCVESAAKWILNAKETGTFYRYVGTSE